MLSFRFRREEAVSSWGTSVSCPDIPWNSLSDTPCPEAFLPSHRRYLYHLRSPPLMCRQIHGSCCHCHPPADRKACHRRWPFWAGFSVNPYHSISSETSRCSCQRCPAIRQTLHPELHCHKKCQQKHCQSCYPYLHQIKPRRVSVWISCHFHRSIRRSCQISFDWRTFCPHCRPRSVQVSHVKNCCFPHRPDSSHQAHLPAHPQDCQSIHTPHTSYSQAPHTEDNNHPHLQDLSM